MTIKNNVNEWVNIVNRISWELPITWDMIEEEGEHCVRFDSGGRSLWLRIEKETVVVDNSGISSKIINLIGGYLNG